MEIEKPLEFINNALSIITNLIVIFKKEPKYEKGVQPAKISSIPSFRLEDSIKLENRNGHTTFIVELCNIGQDIASDIEVLYDVTDEEIQIPQKSTTKNKKYLYSDYLFNNKLMRTESCNFGITLLASEGSTPLETNMDNTVGKCTFSITYIDSNNDKYAQDFGFHYNTNDKNYPTGRLYSSMPRLVEAL